MKKVFALLLCFVITINAQIKFDDYFVDQILRFDFFHTGNKTTETISFDKLVKEGQWSCPKKNLIDPFGYGNYFFKIFDLTSNNLIYSRGFSTLYQEWQTTEESKNTIRSFSGSLIMPFPKEKIRVEIYRRDRKNNFVKKFDYSIDPKNYFIVDERIRPYDNFKVHYSGDPSSKLDIFSLLQY